MVDTPNPNNGKLLVEVSTKLDQVMDRMGEDRLYTATRFDSQDQKIDDLTKQLGQANVVHAACMERQDTRWENHDKAHAKLDEERNQKRNQGDTLAAGTGVMAAAIAAVYTALKGSP